MEALQASYLVTTATSWIAGAVCLAFILIVRRGRAAAAAGDVRASNVVVLPIYEPVLWAVAACFLAQSLLLAIPGPFPAVPAWFAGASYANAPPGDANGGGGGDSGGVIVTGGGTPWQAAGLYWMYWFVFELMSEGFGFIMLHRYPSPEAFGSALRYAILYAALASGLTTLAFNQPLLGFSTATQKVMDAVFMITPCTWYAGLLVAFTCFSHRRGMLPYVLFSLAWRLAQVSLLFRPTFDDRAAASIALFRSLATPVFIYVTLWYDTRYWQGLGQGLVVTKGGGPTLTPAPTNGTTTASGGAAAAAASPGLTRPTVASPLVVARGGRSGASATLFVSPATWFAGLWAIVRPMPTPPTGMPPLPSPAGAGGSGGSATAGSGGGGGGKIGPARMARKSFLRPITAPPPPLSTSGGRGANGRAERGDGDGGYAPDLEGEGPGRRSRKPTSPSGGAGAATGDESAFDDDSTTTTTTGGEGDNTSNVSGEDAEEVEEGGGGGVKGGSPVATPAGTDANAGAGAGAGEAATTVAIDVATPSRVSVQPPVFLPPRPDTARSMWSAFVASLMGMGGHRPVATTPPSLAPGTETVPLTRSRVAGGTRGVGQSYGAASQAGEEPLLPGAGGAGAPPASSWWPSWLAGGGAGGAGPAASHTLASRRRSKSPASAARHGGGRSRHRGGTGDSGGVGLEADSESSVEDGEGGASMTTRLKVELPASATAYRPMAAYVSDQSRRFREMRAAAYRAGGYAAVAHVEQRAREEVHMMEGLRTSNAAYLVDYTRLVVGPFLDKGATAAVHYGLYAGQPVAIKNFRVERIDPDAVAFLHSENAISARFNHVNIVKYYGLCVMPPHISLVFEYCDYGSLYHFLDRIREEREDYADYYGPAALAAYGCTGKLKVGWAATGTPTGGVGVHGGHMVEGGGYQGGEGRAATPRSSGAVPPPPPGLTWLRRLLMARGGARALAYLHSDGGGRRPVYMHRDVKSQNFLVSGSKFVLKLSDFGETRPYVRGRTEESGIGTVHWMAPEMMRRTDYGPPIDIYSYGMVLWELATYDHPFRLYRPDMLEMLVCQGHRPEIPADCPADYAALIRACWQADPTKRPTANDVVEALSHMVHAERAMRARVRTGGGASKAAAGSR